MKIDNIERKTLVIVVIVNLIMAVAGWVTYNISGSEAMLLDGNFSFVAAIATIVAIYISKNKHKKTDTFPYGSYVYEAAFILTKGLLILGIVVMAMLQNIFKIYDFFQGEKITPIISTPIYYYTIFITVLIAGMLLYFKRQNKRVENKSSLLLVEEKTTQVDGALTIVTGIVFFLLSFVQEGSKVDFLMYIGDSIIVILFSLVMLNGPLKIIKNSFIELGGGSIQNQEEKRNIENVIRTIISDKFSFDTFISKVGSGYLIVIYVKPINDHVTLDTFKEIQNQVKVELLTNYSAVAVEIALKN